MTWLFLHFHWAFPTLQEFMGTEVHSTDGRDGGWAERRHTDQAPVWGRYGAGGYRHWEHTPSPKAPHLPASSLFPGPATCSSQFWWPLHCPMLHQDLVSDSDPLKNLEPEWTRQSRKHKENQLTLIYLPHNYKAPSTEASKMWEPPTWPQGTMRSFLREKGTRRCNVV